MPNLSTRNQVLLGALLMTLLIVTRLPQIVTSELGASLIPVSTIGIFFLMGVYFRQLWLLTLSFVVVWTMDMTGMTWQADTEFCLSNSYAVLLLSYVIYWAGGRGFSHLYAGNNLKSLALLSLIAPLSAAVGYFVASLGFHYLSMQSTLGISTLWSEYVMRLPAHLEGLVVYLVIAAIIHIALTTWYQRQTNTQHA